MTFNAAAWAIDGATINSALARAQAYAANSGQQGIVQLGDLKVTQLGVPGQGVLVSAGSALVLNGYQGASTDQMYTVTNPAAHTVPAVDMPASNPAAKSYILAIVIGDPEFSQIGHPWMGAGDPPVGEEDTFVYVRPTLVEVSAGATTLSVGYPALPLARIDIPANTTTVTNAMIQDLRTLARKRTQLEQDYVTSNETDSVTSDVWRRVGAVDIVTVRIPDWAVKAKIQGFAEGMRLHEIGTGRMSAYIKSNDRATAITNIDETAKAAADDRKSYQVAGTIDVSDLRGTTQSFDIRAQATTAGDNGFLKWNSATGLFLSVFFEEQPI